MSKAEVKRHQEELQRRILELIQDFELKTDWRVEIVAYNPAASRVRIVVKDANRTIHVTDITPAGADPGA